MADEIDDLLWGGNTTTQPVVTSQGGVVGTTQTIDDVFKGSNVQATEKQFEESLEPILRGLPDNGRILRDNKTGTLVFRSNSYSTSNQDEIKRIIDEGKQGEVVDLGAEAESKFTKDILGQIPESGLLSQQFMRGALGGGSWMDEVMTSDPAEQWKYEKARTAYEQEYPERAYPAQIAGLGASTYLTGGLAQGIGKIDKVGKAVNVVKNWYSKLAPLAQKTAQVSGVSALSGAEGLLYGAGDGNTLDERTVNALQTGALNTAITAPIAVAFPIVASMIDRFKIDKAKIGAIATEFGISVEASRFIKDAFDSGATLAEMMEKVSRSGNERMIADANTAFTKLLDAAATVSPQAGGDIQKIVGDRVTGSSTKLASDLDTSLGVQPQGEKTIYDVISEETKVGRSDAYTKAFSQPVDYTSPQGQQIIRTLQVLPQKTVDGINTLLAIRGKSQRLKYKGVDKNGNIQYTELPDVETLDLIKRELDNIAEGARDPLTQNISGISNMVADEARKAIRDNLKAINPAYADALSQGQGKILTQQAVRLGTKLMKDGTPLDEVKIFMRNASKEEVKGVRQGLREQIESIMSNAKPASTTGRPEDVSEAMKLITTMSSRSVRLKVEQILGKKTSDAMFKRLDETRSAIELQAGTRTGSATASRQEIMGTAERMIERGPIGTLFEGQPIKAVQKLRDFFTGTGDDYLQSRKEEIFKEVADLLTKTGKGGKDVDMALRYLDAVKSGQKLSNPQASYLTLLIKNGLQSTSAPIATGVGAQRFLTEEK